MPWLEPSLQPRAIDYRGRRAVRIDRSSLRPPILSRPSELRRWRLEEPYELVDAARGRVVRVDKGFTFDLASVPRFLWPVIAPFELSIVAPLLHDFLYQGGVSPREYARSEADALFRDVMTLEGVEAWRRRLAYRGVRLFGRGSWKEAP